MLSNFMDQRGMTLEALAELPPRYMGVHTQDFVRSLWDTPAATRGQAEDALKAFSHYYWWTHGSLRPGWRLLRASWRRKARATGREKASANDASAGVASGVQPPPPAIMIGRCAAACPAGHTRT